MREVEERYALATSAALDGIYEWDLLSGRLLLTQRAAEFFALPADELTPKAWNDCIHPDDFQSYRDALVRHFKGDVTHLEHEYRIRDAAGGYRWILDRGTGVRDANGRVTKVVGAISDINLRKLGDIETRRARDQAEQALDQQTAMTEILRVMSRSLTDPQPVFELVAQRAGKLCRAEVAVVSRFDGALIQLAAIHGVKPDAVEIVRALYPMRLDQQTVTARVVRDAEVVHIDDVLADPTYALKEFARAAEYRAGLGVPIVRDGQVLGSIFLGRANPYRFADSEIELLKAFADQAAIAIGNVRLFNETREALERQTATSDVLQAISNAQTDASPVFETIARNAYRLSGAVRCNVLRYDAGLLHIAACCGFSHEDEQQLRRRYPVQPGDASVMSGRVILSGRVEQIDDALRDPLYDQEHAATLTLRRMLGVPMLRDGAVVGVIVLAWRDPGKTPGTLIDLLQTFASQAVIAIENVRLFNETKEALERQTATSDILRVISQSPRDVQPVFDTIAAASLKLCRGTSATVVRFDGKCVDLVALASFNSIEAEAVRRCYPSAPNRDTVASRAILTRDVVNLRDVLEDPDYAIQDVARSAGYRSALAVPLMQLGKPIGAIGVGRPQIGEFSDKEISLLRTFADQAVIAIENVRLFTALEARTADLTRSVQELNALGEVGQAVSSTLNLETVLSTIVSRATQLSGMDGGSIWEYDEGREEFHLHATNGLADELVDAFRVTPIRKGEGALGQLGITAEPVQITDIEDERIYQSRVRDALVRCGYRSVLAVPLLREDRLLGALAVNRRSPGNFDLHVIQLLKTFATQSALAIQNARLFREIEVKSRQLEIASQHKSEFLANMSHELRTPLNAIIGFSEVLTERMFGDINEKQAEYLGDILESGRHLLSLINEILDLSKIEAGRMELELSDFDLAKTIEHTLILVRERAQKRGIRLVHKVDEQLRLVRADERKVKQVLLNLLSNALKFTPEGGRIDVLGTAYDGTAEIAVADTGVGIAPADQEVVFEEFRQVGTADKKREGTGLGLAISRKFIELHGGKIWVKSTVGSGATFSFTLPLH